MRLEINNVASTSVESGNERVSTEVQATLSDNAPWGWKVLTACLAGVRSKDSKIQALAMQLAMKHLADTTPDQLLAAMRILEVGLARGHSLDDAEQQALMKLLDQRWASSDHRVRWEATKLLIFLESPTIITRATDYLKTATTSEDLLFYPMHLRYPKEGWTLEQRRIAFDALNRAEKLNGASSYFKAIADTRAELAAVLTSEEAVQLASVIHIAKPVALSPHAMPGHSFKAWKLADLEPMLGKVASGRSYEKAKAALVSTQCVFCHRVSADNTLPAGIVGPDLTQVSARFGRRDLLMHILEPSVVIDEKFRSTIVTKVDGQQVIGTLDSEDDERVVLKPNALSPEVIEIGKSMITKRTISEISPMPLGLLNTLKAEQILDLLAWFEAGGDPKAKVWSK
jgi:putative heme-binding domain-containing protein